jgi:anti-sigma factor RsiW
MNDVREEELSALIDGELDATRALQVRTAIAADPALRAEYETLMRIDTTLLSAANAVRFAPDIALPESSANTRSVGQWIAPPAVAAALLLVRLAPKFIDMAALGWLLQIMAICAVLALIAKMATEEVETAAAKP